ncbi:uncharacterized protein LODBEIA_P59920 [Lodderomyces beijingensis]|uniref:Mitochondrial adapter protein MCP1 transmembrane domain-containing protein n=1 Tax=Lodderomyces beijingensis TaxID=1775926 RepID=A0ABP0ZUG0_9ASCO
MEIPREELHKIAPTPVYFLDESPSPASPSTPLNSTSNSSSHHGGSKKWVIPTLCKIQKYSAWGLVSFLGIHLTSVVVVPILPISHDLKQQVFSLAKAVYQDVPLYEPVFIFGAGITHILSGIALRLVRYFKRRNQHRSAARVQLLNAAIDIKDSDDDIGLGGISNIFGLGYRKSITTTQFGLTPLQFSGYVSIPFVLFHIYKFRYMPWAVEGDSSLINLDYITYVLNLKHPWVNTVALLGLVLSVTYHVTIGGMKLQGFYSRNWKRAGLVMVNVLGFAGMVSIYMFKRSVNVDLHSADFVGKAFSKYINAFLL